MPKTSNRLLISLLALVVALVVAACGGGTQPATAPKVTEAPKPAPTMAPAASKPADAPKTTGGGSIGGPFQGEAKQLNGAGATFPAALYSKWFNEYNKVTGVQVNYQSIGSGGGIKGISDATVDFGASDAPMSDEQLKAAKGEVLHIPMALGAVVPTYNMAEVKDVLKFTPDTLAGIFLGDITKWNDAKLVADNPALANINKDIIVIHRSDGSGTTSIWVDYLSTVNQKWAGSVGRGTSVNWPVGLGGKGNEGVAGEVKNNPYSIGYVELIYAIQNKLPAGQVKNKAGKFVTPDLNSVTAAAAGISAKLPADLRFSMVNAEGEASYPIAGATWFLVYKEMPDKAKAVALTRLMWWNIHDAQKLSAELGYAPLPQAMVAKGEEKIKSITTSGQPAFPGK
ncbi:MAG: phosphate ABC transporter substrate-binding protein PstS [Anaerolineae bacterium]|nr:phosphate ABC transporter substrate-binding protein PstS [Anaerolineae bacterium]